MKTKLNSNVVVNIIIIVVVVLYITPFAIRMLAHTHYNSGQGNIISDMPRSIDPTVSMNLPYYKYISVRDSIKTMRNLKNQSIPNASGFQLGYVIGTTGNYILCDTCTVKDYIFSQTLKGYIYSATHPNNNTQYFIMLPGWSLKAADNDYYNDDSVRFFRDHNKAFIRKEMIYKSTKNKDGSVSNYLHYVDIPVSFGYDQRHQWLLIPVSKSTRNVVNILLGICTFMFCFYMLYLLSAFLKFIADLSKGYSFTDKNVNRLRLIAISLLVYPCVLFLLALLMRLIFYKYFIPDVTLNQGLLKYSWKPLVLGIVFLVLYRAFRQGKLLKDEQDLTV